MEGLGWDVSFNDTEVEEKDKIEPYMFSHPIALKLNAAMEGVTPAGSDIDEHEQKSEKWWLHKWHRIFFFWARGFCIGLMDARM